MSFYLGIDFGTSGARAIAIDASAQPCAQATCRFESDRPSAEDWRQTLLGLIQALPEQIREQVCAIALNGTSSTVLLCDRAGQPLDDPLLYSDDRGATELPALRAFFAQPHYATAPCQANVLNATSSLVKVLWWKTQPCFTAAKYLMHQADWLAFLLHGQPGISDYHNCLKLGYDVARLCYPDWLDDLGLSPLLPLVLEPGAAIARVQPAIATQLGLSPTCQICAGTTDSIAAFLASGASTPGAAVTSLGSTLVLKLLSTTPVENSAEGIYSHRLGDGWLVGGASNTGGAVLRQFFTAAELDSLSAQLVPELESPLDYYPLTRPGERFPINDPTLSPRLEPRPATSVQFLHGLLESMARIEATGYQRLQALGATPLTQVYTAGGGASNSAWQVIRQRHLPVPVLAARHTEAAYGTAQLAMKQNQWG